MKIFDYFYEIYFLPLVESITGLVQMLWDIVLTILDWLLAAVLFITIPIWIIPYLAIRDKRESKGGRKR